MNDSVPVFVYGNTCYKTSTCMYFILTSPAQGYITQDPLF